MSDSYEPWAWSNTLGGVYYLHGDDEFQKERAARALVEQHLDAATRDFNYDLLRGSETDLETLASVIGTPPLMAEWRVVFIREAEAFASSPKARALLLKVAASPPSGLALILMASQPSGSKAKFYKDISKAAQSTEFSAIRPDDAPGWLIDWAKQNYNRTLEGDAATALASAVGTSLGVLDQELAKLSELVGEGEPITLEAVRQAGTVLPTQDRWAWFDLVGTRRFSEALRGLSVLIAQGESGVALVIGLSAQLLRLGVFLSGGSAALQQILPPHQKWLAKRIGGQAKGWTLAELDDALMELRRADQLLKAAGFSDQHIVEEWLLGRMVTARGAA